MAQKPRAQAQAAEFPLILRLLTIGSALFVALALLVTLAQAAGDDSPPPKPAKSAYDQAREKIADEDWTGALTLLQTADAQRPGNADVKNYLGYVNRKLGNLDAAQVHYEAALAIAPAHKGALEYYGELHLMRKDREAAEALRERLAAACPEGCEELDELDEAIAAFKASSAN